MRRLRKTPIRWDRQRKQYVVTYWIPVESGLPSKERRRRRFAKTQEEAEEIYNALKNEYAHLGSSKPTCDPDISLTKYVKDWLPRVEHEYQSKSYRTIRDNLRVTSFRNSGSCELRISVQAMFFGCSNRFKRKDSYARVSANRILTMG